MAGKADGDQFAAPSANVMFEVGHPHIRVIDAPHHEAGKGKWFQRLLPELDHAGVKPQCDIQRTWRYQQRAPDLPRDGAIGITCGKQASEAVCNEKGALCLRKRLVELRLPIFQNGTSPVLLLRDQCIGPFPGPMTLPVSLRRTVKTRKNKGGKLDTSDIT